MDTTSGLRDYGLAFLLYEHGLGFCRYEFVRELFIFIKLFLNGYLKFYLDKTKPLEENGKHPPLTIPFTAMINFIKATSTSNEHVRIVSSEQCHYKSGDIVKVIDGEFETYGSFCVVEYLRSHCKH